MPRITAPVTARVTAPITAGRRSDSRTIPDPATPARRPSTRRGRLRPGRRTTDERGRAGCAGVGPGETRIARCSLTA